MYIDTKQEKDKRNIINEISTIENQLYIHLLHNNDKDGLELLEKLNGLFKQYLKLQTNNYYQLNHPSKIIQDKIEKFTYNLDEMKIAMNSERIKVPNDVLKSEELFSEWVDKNIK